MIIKLKDLIPKVSKDAWVSENAAVVGDVKIGPGSTVWYSASLRGDDNKIRIGEATSIQDNTVIHVEEDHETKIGDYVTVGHNVTLHGCTIEDNVVIGMGSIVLNGARIGENSIIGAGSLVTENKEIPPNTIAFGNPVKIIRKMTDEEIEGNKKGVLAYRDKIKAYKNDSERID